MRGRPARWTLPAISDSTATAVAQSLGLSSLAARILVHRGYADPGSARRFLTPGIDALHDPFLLLDSRAAVDRLLKAIRDRERILLYGDYDVDGTTSIVILMKALELAGASPDFHVPHRIREGYGMRPEVIDQAAASGIRLIISVDTGIRAIDVVRYAAELGIDVIVTDHHLPEAELPPALAVLNPNRPGCPYPEKNLCGAGVAFKLVQGLLTELDWPESRKRRLAESFLKLAAIATVADVTPLSGENRAIVKHGLAGLSATPNPGLRALLDLAGFQNGSSPTATQVAFRIAPRINAAGRMDDARTVVEMFLTSDAGHARRLAEQLHALNQDRQETEAGMLDTILRLCLEKPVTDNECALVFAGEGWHRGVVGIVASRVVDRFHRPAFVLGIDNERGQAIGSGRSIPEFHLLEALESMHDLFIKFGGHRQAAGVTLAADRVEEFRERFNAYAAARLAPEMFCGHVKVDAVAEAAEINDRSAAEILSMSPFGFGNPSPVVALRGVEAPDTPAIFKEKHLRLRLRQGTRSLFVKAWDFAERIDEFAPGRRLDAAVCLEHDPYSEARGYPAWAVTLRDVRAHEDK
jgi:single-stranded-DNA-specific exonuclease